MRRLNLGCGSSKIDGFINIDTEKSCKPDIVCNFINGLPYKTSTVDEVVFFHCIEHISKRFHKRVLSEIWRVLKPGSPLLITYPEFLECVKNWKTNYKGQKAFWENTIFGRQLYPADHHVCIMHTPDFKELLVECGFANIRSTPEPTEKYNTVVGATKGPKPANYEDQIRDYTKRIKLAKKGK